MIHITVKENESIDKALKRFKKKFEKTGVLKNIRSRAYFAKPSVTKRQAKLRAIYRNSLLNQENNI